MFALPVQGRIDGFAFPIGPTPNGGEIFLVNLLLLHQQAEFSRRRCRFRHQHQPTGFPVEPVDN